jgi:hypothetical protein
MTLPSLAQTLGVVAAQFWAGQAWPDACILPTVSSISTASVTNSEIPTFEISFIPKFQFMVQSLSSIQWSLLCFNKN